MGSTPRPSASTTRPSESCSHRQQGLPLQGSLPQQAVDCVFCPPQRDAPVSVTEKVAPRCTAVFVLPRHSVAVFVDGCPSHGTRHFRGPNASRWEAKITANMERDARNTQAATDAGWTVVRIWE